MGMHTSNCSKLNDTMKVFLFAIVLALSIQDIMAVNDCDPPYPRCHGRNGFIPDVGRNKDLRISQETIDTAINAAVDGICNCAAPIPQWTNSLYNAGESCLMSLGLGAPASATTLCTATALGLLNDDGSVASVDLFKAAHGGSDEFDTALDDCYANSFDAINDVEASKAFGICIELTIADMCNIPLARHELLLTTEAMSRDLCN